MDESSTTSAPLHERAVAGLIDLGLAGGVGQLGLAQWLDSSGLKSDDAGAAAALVVLVTYRLAVELIYRKATGHRFAGRSPGMRLAGLRVAAPDSDEPPPAPKTLLHALFGYLGFVFLFWGAFRGGPAVHDTLFGVRVIKLRAEPEVDPVTMDVP